MEDVAVGRAFSTLLKRIHAKSGVIDFLLPQKRPTHKEVNGASCEMLFLNLSKKVHTYRVILDCIKT